MKFCTFLSLIQLYSLSSLVAGQVTKTTTREHVVPTFTLDEIQLGRRLPELSEVLRTTGLFAVKTTGASSSHLSVMNGLCHCLQDWNLPGVESVDSILLGDGQTQRTTIATATIGKDPLPFANPEILEQQCGSKTVKYMETLRDEVAVVSQAVVKSMDQVLGIGSKHDRRDEGPLLESESGMTYRTLASIVHSANHLEHFHHYQKKSSSERTEKTVEWHTDAGLFLTFLPAHDCQSNGNKPDDSFWVQLPGGEQAQAYFEPGSVAVMMGAGAEHWLHSSSLSLRATRHAVKMNQSESRVWYGMMHLVPEDSIIQESPRRTFGDMKQNMKVAAQNNLLNGKTADTIAIGCGPSIDTYPDATPTNEIIDSPRRRRLQHVQDASVCNNVTNFFCWTQCLEIPNYEQAEGYITEGNSLYCLDPGILARSGNQVSKAVEPCIGKVHNSNCQGIWHRTSPSVAGWPVEYNSTLFVEEKYCYGGTSMYMDGFHWIHDTTCVIYLFPSLVLSTKGRYIGACFGTILFGMMVEAIIFRRRKSIVNFQPGMSRLLASAAFYTLQLTMGYMVMLIVMTYSGPLFLSCIIGLVLGHVVFNAGDALLNKPKPSSEDDESRDESTKEDEKEEGGCCSHEMQHEGEQNYGTIVDETPEAAKPSCCGTNKARPKKRVPDRTQGIPEGSTPCCQNSLDVC